LSDDGFLGFAGTIRNPEGIIDGLLAGLRPCSFAYMYHFSIVALKLDGDTVLALKLPANPFPAPMNAADLELKPNGVDQMISQDRDE
jgi:hypothetical protein